MNERLNNTTQELSERDQAMMQAGAEGTTQDTTASHEAGKRSAFDRIVGSDLTAEDRRRVQDIYSRKFTQHDLEVIRDHEIEKTPEQVRVIEYINQLTDVLRTKFGLESFPIPIQNIHIITQEVMKKAEKPASMIGAFAFFSRSDQAIYIDEASWHKSKLVFAQHLFHEMVHFKSHNALQVEKSVDEVSFYSYRGGFEITTRDNSKTYFLPLNEAITEELAKQFATGLSIDDPLLGKEVREKRELCDKYGIEPEEANELLFLRTFPDGNIGGQQFLYGRERQALGLLMEKILAKNPDRFTGKAEVFDLFVRGAIPGDIMPIGRIVDESFGKGTFRRIGKAETGEELIRAVQELADR